MHRMPVAYGPWLALVMLLQPAWAATPLPDYDIRTAEPAAAAAARSANSSAAEKGAAAARQQARRQLIGQISGLRIDSDDLFDTPRFIASTRQFLTGPVAGGPAGARQIVRRFIDSHRALFGIDPAEADNGRVAREFQTRHNGVTHLTFQQQIGGIDVWGCALHGNVTRQGELINVSSTMLPRPAGDFRPPRATLGPRAAIRAAAASVGIPLTVDPAPLAPPAGPTQRQTWSQTPDLRPDEPLTTELIYFPLTRADVRPAWSVLMAEKGIGNTYELFVDATNGQILWRWNRLHFASESASFSVYISDSPSPLSPGTSTPSEFQPPLVSRALVTINPADVVGPSPNGWIADGVNETLGNNVDAHLDLNNDNVADLPRPAGSPYRMFDFALDLTQPPSAYQNASVTQFFYLTNRFHDRLHALGFDEAAGNFQTDNFGRGGAGNDPVQADCQDGNGQGTNVNNANFGTGGADGSTARCQMRIFTGPTPDRDSSLDADIVYHELAHGVSIRLHQGNLVDPQGSGMGEGWSDYIAVSLNAEDGDDPNGVYAVGGYAVYQVFSLTFTTNYYFGIRRYPYCTNKNINPLTLRYIDPGQVLFPSDIPRNTAISGAAHAVHNVGEVWCAALLDCRARLSAIYGFGGPPGGNQRMMQLVLDGMKLSPSSPNFVQARDAILQADLVNNGGVNQSVLWQAFAGRGMGSLATVPAASSTLHVVEFYDVNFSYPDGLPTRLSPGQPTSFRVDVSGTSQVTPITGTGRLICSVNGEPFVSTNLAQTAANHYVATLPARSCLDQVRYYVAADVSWGTAYDPPIAPTLVRSAVVATTTSPVFSDHFETDLGWTVTNGVGMSDGAWERGIPSGGGARADSPYDYDGNGSCFLTANRTGNSDLDGGATTLNSPVINLSATTNPYISYARWFSNNTGSNPESDPFVVEVSADGGSSWVNLETVGPTQASLHPEVIGGWYVQNYRIADRVPVTSQFRIRFAASDFSPASLIEAAVDAVEIVDAPCTPPTNKADFNLDSRVDTSDLALLTACSTGPGIHYNPQALPPDCTLAPDGQGVLPPDFDSDNDVDQSDFAIFQRCYSGENVPADPNCAN